MTRGERLAFWAIMAALLAVAPCCVRPVVREPEGPPAWRYVLDVMAALSHPPQCALLDLPEKPVVHLFDTGDDDPFRRTFILRRDFEDWVAYEGELRQVIDRMMTCLRRLSTDAATWNTAPGDP